VNNHSTDTKWLLEIAYPLLDEVELFTPDAQDKYQSNLMGGVKKFNTRKYNYPNYIFDLDISPYSPKTYYLRVKSAEQIILPISINRADALWQSLSRENLFSGIFIGAILIMVVYNLFIFFSVKDSSYIYYAIYVATLGLTQIGIKGVTFQYLWGNYPSFELKSVVLFAIAAIIGAAKFTQEFLNTNLRSKKVHLVLNILIGIQILALIITLAGMVQEGFQIMQISTTFILFGVLVVSAIVYKEGYAPARFLFFSWSALLSGAVIFALKDYGILPYNALTSHAMQGAAIIEMAVLSFGLADRINILKKGKEASQAEALSIAQQNENLIREQNIFLESKVKERTTELEASNEELSITLDDLKQAQMQLVESEKMASLGQLTAGIAHEINNPINFVTSNVTPLQRDVDVLMNVISTIEDLSSSNTDITERQKKIEEYKEEIDYEYLKTEIAHLFKGINDGASRTAEIVQGLRVFSRLDEDDLKFADINNGIESTLVIANNLLSGIKITKKYGELPLIECYPGKLNQAFLNIVSNAAHAIRICVASDGVQGEIMVETRFVEHAVIIEISDNGIGMDDQTIKKVFEPFFTTKEVGEGTGLGMSITYNIVKKHRGSVYLLSDLGKGTKVVIELPVMRGD
jgi:hypothetical protein